MHSRSESPRGLDMTDLIPSTRVVKAGNKMRVRAYNDRFEVDEKDIWRAQRDAV